MARRAFDIYSQKYQFMQIVLNMWKLPFEWYSLSHARGLHYWYKDGITVPTGEQFVNHLTL